MTDRNIEMMAQKIAQQQDSGIYSATYDFEASPKETFLDDIANNTPNSGMFDVVKKKSKKLKHQVINLITMNVIGILQHPMVTRLEF